MEAIKFKVQVQVHVLYKMPYDRRSEAYRLPQMIKGSFLQKRFYVQPSFISNSMLLLFNHDIRFSTLTFVLFNRASRLLSSTFVLFKHNVRY